jgi:hypothetical protein
MAVGVSTFPFETDTHTSLMRLGLGVYTELARPVSATSMEIAVLNPEGLSRPDGVILLETEWVTYSAITGNVLTVERRGAFQEDGGYPPSAHLPGAKISQAMTPMHHRVHSDAIIALEEQVGGHLTADNFASFNMPDTKLRVVDNSDGSKQLAFETSGITTGTTRTLTAPDASGTIALVPTATLRTNATTVANGATSSPSVSCNAGEIAVGVGCNVDAGTSTTVIARSRFDSTTQVTCTYANTSGATRTITVQAMCLKFS